MTKSIEINAGEWFAVSDKVILVREQESILGLLSKLGTTDNDRVAFMLTFKGKLNNKDRSGDVTVVMSPEDAFEHANQIFKTLEWFVDQLKEASEGKSDG